MQGRIWDLKVLRRRRSDWTIYPISRNGGGKGHGRGQVCRLQRLVDALPHATQQKTGQMPAPAHARQAKILHPTLFWRKTRNIQVHHGQSQVASARLRRTLFQIVEQKYNTKVRL